MCAVDGVATKLRGSEVVLVQYIFLGNVELIRLFFISFYLSCHRSRCCLQVAQRGFNNTLVFGATAAYNCVKKSGMLVVWLRQKVKPACEPCGHQAAGAYPSFCNMKRLRVFLLSSG